MKDLVILVADKDMEMTLRGLLSRPQSLGVRAIQYDIYTHPQHDPGVRAHAAEFLRPYHKMYRYALVLFDREGCGADAVSAEQIAQSVQQQIENAGWQERCAVVVIDPELEVWVFSDSPHVAEVIADGDAQALRAVLARHTGENRLKPENPKSAMEDIIRLKKIPRSSALFQRLAEKVSLSRCTDRSFVRLRETLARWFPIDIGGTKEA